MHDGTVRPVQSRDHALFGRNHLVALDHFRNVELINRPKITSVSIKEEGWQPQNAWRNETPSPFF